MSTHPPISLNDICGRAAAWAMAVETADEPMIMVRLCRRHDDPIQACVEQLPEQRIVDQVPIGADGGGASSG